jgi:ubiquinol-cytochrome c reductase cytochrome c subunit
MARVGRDPHGVPATAAVVLAVCLLGAAAWIVTQAGARAQSPDLDLVDRGGEVFQATCAACHGTRGEGGPGPGIADGPPLLGIELAYLDMTVRTGRMPIAERSVGVYADQLTEEDRRALVAYAEERLDVVGEIPTVQPGHAARGQELYVRNCAACHGAAADGGISGASVFVPPLVGIDGIAIAEATRVGPFEMPAFDPAVLSSEDIDDIVAYLEAVDASPRTPVGLREVDQAVAGLLAVGLAIAASLVLFIVARVRRWYPHEPGAYHEAPPFEPRS